MKHCGFPMASNVSEGVELRIEAPVPDFTSKGYHEEALAYYNEHARRFVDELQNHAPGGFVDAVLGELLHRKATIFRVAAPVCMPREHCPPEGAKS